MTSEQITSVQTSFALVRPIADTAATLFYDRLFELNPSLRGLLHAANIAVRKNLLNGIIFAHI